MRIFESKSCSDIEIFVNENDGLIKTIDVYQDGDVVVISEKCKAIEIAEYILKISEYLED